MILANVFENGYQTYTKIKHAQDGNTWSRMAFLNAIIGTGVGVGVEVWVWMGGGETAADQMVSCEVCTRNIDPVST